AECNARDAAAVNGAEQLPTARRLPYADGSVVAARREQPAVCAEGDRNHLHLVFPCRPSRGAFFSQFDELRGVVAGLERPARFSAAEVEELGASLLARDGELAAVRRKRERAHHRVLDAEHRGCASACVVATVHEWPRVVETGLGRATLPAGLLGRVRLR